MVMQSRDGIQHVTCCELRLNQGLLPTVPDHSPLGYYIGGGGGGGGGGEIQGNNDQVQGLTEQLRVY